MMSIFDLDDFVDPPVDHSFKSVRADSQTGRVTFSTESEQALVSTGFTLEAFVDGVGRYEIEKVFYAQFDDLEAIKAQSVRWEDHIQYELKFQSDTFVKDSLRQRIRAVMDQSGGVAYINTVKARGYGVRSMIPYETENYSSRSAFLQYVSASARGMVKRRYVIPLEGTPLEWEIDLFYRPIDKRAGDKEIDLFYPWCKIDLEAKEGFILKTEPKLPEMFYNVKTNETAAPGEIGKLYDDYFLWKKDGGFPVWPEHNGQVVRS
jgi:hypothetical protein